jgi:hypothetical protein
MALGRTLSTKGINHYQRLVWRDAAMPDQFKAAIHSDAALERPLGEISAAQFLQVLTHPTDCGSTLGIGSA